MTGPATGDQAASTLLGRAEAAWSQGDAETAVALFEQAVVAGEREHDLETRVAAVLGLARGQHYNLTPGRLPVHLHAAYDAVSAPATRTRLAAALARCWAYANEPRRARPFADEALALAEAHPDPAVLADALDAALTSHWGPDDLALRRDWAVRLGDVAAHLRDPELRLQSALWGLSVAWEVLDLPRMHRSMRALELVAEESPRARFFAATRRLPLELLRGNVAVAELLIEQAGAAAAAAPIPDAFGVLQSMHGYSAYFTGDPDGCAAVGEVFEEYAAQHGVAAVRAEAALMWLGAGRLDKVAEMVGAFSRDVLDSLPRDSDWLLTVQCVAEGAIAVRDLETTASVVELLLPYAGRSVVNAGAVMWHGVTDDTIGRALELLGRPEDAQRHVAAALATYERINARWWRDRLLGHGSARSTVAIRVVHLHPQFGGLWLAGTSGSTFVLPHMRGLEHLRVLLDNPGTDVSALDLVAGGGPVVEQPGIEVLDDTARRTYRARLAELDRELELSDRDDLREERDVIRAQLAGGTGLGGRDRRTGDHSERARVAVRKAIINALARIAEQDPALARHLHEHVRTGHQCRYSPDPDNPLTWITGADRAEPSTSTRGLRPRAGL
jgi:tetratricopeptide (TPR) repeat protein